MFNTTITLAQFLQAGQETFYMVLASLLFGSLLGIAIGTALVLSRADGLRPNMQIFRPLNLVVNVIRSLPFIILLIALIPFTRLVVGIAIGTSASVVPLTIFIAPYIGRLVENSLLEVNAGIIEAANAMGATTWQIIWYFLLPEAKSSLILSITTATIGLIGASAMAGAIGGGGIGDLAINYGYNRFDNFAMLVTVVSLVIIVQSIQSLGNYLARKARHE